MWMRNSIRTKAARKVSSVSSRFISDEIDPELGIVTLPPFRAKRSVRVRRGRRISEVVSASVCDGDLGFCPLALRLRGPSFSVEDLFKLGMEIMSRINLPWVGLSLLLLSVAGCGASALGPPEELVPVSGTATFGGKAYERLIVTFIPTGAGNPAHQGTAVTGSSLHIAQ